MERLLLAVEKDGARRGWDAPPSLLMMWDARESGALALQHIGLRSGGLVASGAYRAGRAISDRALEPNPAVALYRMAVNIIAAPSHPPVAYARQSLAQPGLLGIAARFEGWHRVMTHEERRADQRALADIPGSVEQRMVCAATVDGGIWMVTRVRGQQPILRRPAGSEKWAGAVPESLAAIAAWLAGDVPTLPAYAPRAWARS